MTLVVKSSDDDVIVLPAWLMKLLDLQEGDKIKTIIEGHTLRLARLDQFLALRGALRDDDDFDAAIALLEQGWQSWTIPHSV
jgi:antitoxin component of MazEF toxin-antitoxin module